MKKRKRGRSSAQDRRKEKERKGERNGEQGDWLCMPELLDGKGREVWSFLGNFFFLISPDPLTATDTNGADRNDT